MGLSNLLSPGKSDNEVRPHDVLYRYSHTPLESSESVRLVRFSVVNSKIHATLENVVLSKAPDYIALSYVWGNPNPEETIKMNGRKLQISPNLASFMRHFDKVGERMEKAAASKPFWIDAVCIDQKNDTEKSIQVRKMKDIYRKASSVVVWLGPDDPVSKRALPRLFVWSDLVDSGVRRHGSYLAFWLNPDWMVDMGFATLKKNSMLWGEFEAVDRFYLERQWWKRIWTVQECMWKAEIMYMCGEQFIPAKCITNSTVVSQRMMSEGGIGSLKFDGCRLPPERDVIKGNLEKTGKPNSVYNVLIWLRPNDATDPRDKVFAALGLVDPLLTAHEKLTINYRLDVLTVYTKVAEYFLETYPNLDWMESIWFKKTPNLPSWVPDWGDGRMRSSLPKTQKDGTAIYSPWGNQGESILRSKIFSKYEIRNGRELHLQGVVIDTIWSLQNPIRFMSEASKVVGSWINVLCDLGPVYQPTGEPILHAAFKTLFFDVEGDIDSVERRGPAIPDNISRATLLDVEWLKRARPSLTRVISQSPEDWLQHIAWRGLAITKHGYIGLVPPLTREGDVICCLANGRTLYVLHENSKERGNYNFIGEAYFHGMMDGQWRSETRGGNIRNIILV